MKNTTKSIEINYAYGKSITVLVPRVKNGNSLVNDLVSGRFKNYRVTVIEGLDEFIAHVIKNGNDNSSNMGNWYAHCNGYCLDAIVDYKSKENKCVTINTYHDYRISKK